VFFLLEILKKFLDFFLFLVFKSKGVDTSRPLVGSCMTSVMASSLSLAAHLIGIKMPIYHVFKNNLFQ
jgi:hypothetical protein